VLNVNFSDFSSSWRGMHAIRKHECFYIRQVSTSEHKQKVHEI
jgi:hypothetical protein